LQVLNYLSSGYNTKEIINGEPVALLFENVEKNIPIDIIGSIE